MNRRRLSTATLLTLLRSRGGVSYDADADAETLFAAMTTEPDDTRKGHINTAIVALKAAGIWDELDELWFFAAHAEQAALLGWKRYKDCLAVNAPTFTTDRGFAGNGTTSYLNTQFVPSTDGVQYTQNDASLGVYSRTDSSGDVSGIGAISDGNMRFAQVAHRLTSGSQLGRVNHSGTFNLTAAQGDSLGLATAQRTASNATELFRNGSSIDTDTEVSVLRPTVAMYICGANVSGTPGGLNTRQYAFAYVGASLSTDQQGDLFDIVEAYLDAIGAGVVA